MVSIGLAESCLTVMAAALVAAVLLHGHADACRLAALGTNQHHLCRRHRRRELHFLALLARTARAQVFDRQVHAFDRQHPKPRERLQHFAGLAAVLAANDHPFVAGFDLHRVYSTSSASEMIFASPRLRSSRATGPKMRVPLGSLVSLSTSTMALSSKRMKLPSARRTSLRVRTITPWWTSPFLTMACGTASLMVTVTMSPTVATRRL